MPPIKRAAAPQAAEVNFGDLDMYAAGGSLPEGDYIVSDHTVQMFQAVRQNGTPAGPARLGAMLTFHSLADPSAEPRTQFYSMGSKAHESFTPNPTTGKGLVPVPGGPASTMNNSTNWAVYLKSLYDCGLPKGIFTNDFSVLDGMHVHIQNQPAPEERKGYQSKTGEAADQGPQQGNATIAVVSEIKEDGKPWEGTGGFPEAAAPVAAAPKPGPRPVAARPVAAPKPAPVAAPVAAPANEDLETTALLAIGPVLEKNPNGTTKINLRTSAFKHAKDNAGDEIAQQMMDTYFGDEDALNGLLGQAGYTLAGPKVVPIA